MLEAGRRWDPQREWATDERAQDALFWNDERLSAGADPVSFGRNNSGTGVGGSTLHYTAYVPRAQPDDFRLHSDFGVGVDWPIGYDDLAPYYDEVEAFLGVSGPSPYPWGPPRPAYKLPPLPLNGAAQLMQRGCAALGIRTSPAANAAVSRAWQQEGYGLRPACTNRGFCQAGCSTGAKAGMDVTYVPLALARGAELRTGTFVTGIETDQAGRVDRRRRGAGRHRDPATLPRPVPVRGRHRDAAAAAAQPPGPRTRRPQLHGPYRRAALGALPGAGRPHQGHPRRPDQRGHAPPGGRGLRRRLPAAVHRRDAGHLRQPGGARARAVGPGAAGPHGGVQPRGGHQHPGRLPAAPGQPAGAVGGAGRARPAQAAHPLHGRREREAHDRPCRADDAGDLRRCRGGGRLGLPALCPYHRHLPHGREGTRVR